MKLPNLWCCLPRQRKIWFCSHWQAPKSMVLLAMASQNNDFMYIGKLPNLWVRMPGHSITLILLTFARYQIYDFAYQGTAKVWFYRHWLATISMVLLAKAEHNYDFTHMGKLPNLWFCLPGQSKTMILSALKSDHIDDFACQDTSTLWVYLHWQATKSMVLLARA